MRAHPGRRDRPGRAHPFACPRPAIRTRQRPARRLFTTSSLDARRALTLPAIRIFRAISRAWQLRFHEEMGLLGIPRPIWSSWCRNPPPVLPIGALERIALVMRVFEAINMLLPRDRADAWMRSPNDAPAFGGRSALDLMLGEGRSGIAAVRAYLLGEIHG